MTKRVHLFILALTLLLAPSLAHAAEATVRLVTGPDYPPYVDTHLPGGGILTQQVLQAFASAGVDAKLEVEPWRRGYIGLIAGRFDATFPYIRTAERDKDLLYSDPIIAAQPVMLVQTGKEGAALDPIWVIGKRICSGVGYGLPPYIDELIRTGRTIRVSPGQQRNCYAMVATSRADFMIEDEATFAAQRHVSPHYSGVTMVSRELIKATRLYLVVAKSNPRADEILRAFNQGLAQVNANVMLTP